MKKRLTKVAPGEWIQPTRRGFRLQCCDCGLIHIVDFRLAKDSLSRARIQFRAFREGKKPGDRIR